MEAYFDNSATTRCFDEVKDIVCKTMTGDFGNPSAMHKKGMEAENYVRKSAQTLAKLLKVNEKDKYGSAAHNPAPVHRGYEAGLHSPLRFRSHSDILFPYR